MILAGFLFICTLAFSIPLANNSASEEPTQTVDSLQQGMIFLKKLTSQQGKWYFNNPEFKRSIKGLIHFLEDEQVDTVLFKISKYKTDSLLIFRRWQDVADTLSIPGFVPSGQINEKMKQLDREIRDQNPLEKIPVPEHLLVGLEKKVPFLPKEKSQILVDRGLFILPDSLKNLSFKKDTLKPGSKKYLHYQQLDSLRIKLIEQARVKYNDSLLRHYIDSVSTTYRNTALTHFSDSLQNQLYVSLKMQNKQLVKSWNDSLVTSMNDSIRHLLPLLEKRAYKYPQDVWLHNLTNDSTRVRLRNGENYSTRMFIKNEQADSLGIKVENLGRNSMKILIDDGVTFTRFKQQQKRDIQFKNFTPDEKLVKVAKRYNVITPWNLGGNSTFGFTQTSLNNWKKGGNSSLSLLAVLKGFANYSNEKLKWENSAELRNGWMRINEEDEETKLQKNDDKLELISRLGISAFKKWYYSGEVDFETQFFNGYNYPDTDNPISAFMAPAKTLIKIGLDYKPNKDFSLFLSPLTSKTVFVRDTALIDQTKFGVSADKRRFWEPGFNADLKFKKTIYTDIVWETKYKMFFNYRNPFNKFDINWENLVSMKLNDYINMNFMLHLIYDDNVTFPTDKLDANGKTIYEPRWQVKELITIGFAYNINRRIYKRQKVN
ncbi:MAG: hypothetical protein A2W89_12305 [Bacteroidetes bacterium GWE2_42_39]|nr:MAG: hypothetical protein A2W92_24395 [Bacteroidetes bacterium GWA2_42_15]OFX99414.1 MAG: hypothetical protein A2W89_12305 [Bacteroidetes bacterium GWE2_42_39]